MREALAEPGDAGVRLPGERHPEELESCDEPRWFRKVSDTAPVVGGFPRVLMRLEFHQVVGTRVLSPGVWPNGAGRRGTG